MPIEWKKYISWGKKIIYFFVGLIFVHFMTQIIMSSSFPEMLKEMNEEEIKSFIANLDKEIFSILIKLYIISYILFSLLPRKIKNSRWYLRGIYFVIFYFFCILIYVWI